MRLVTTLVEKDTLSSDWLHVYFKWYWLDNYASKVRPISNWILVKIWEYEISTLFVTYPSTGHGKSVLPKVGSFWFLNYSPRYSEIKTFGRTLYFFSEERFGKAPDSAHFFTKFLLSVSFLTLKFVQNLDDKMLPLNSEKIAWILLGACTLIWTFEPPKLYI